MANERVTIIPGVVDASGSYSFLADAVHRRGRELADFLLSRSNRLVNYAPRNKESHLMDDEMFGYQNVVSIQATFYQGATR
jgi:hypothetical protein